MSHNEVLTAVDKLFLSFYVWATVHALLDPLLAVLVPQKTVLGHQACGAREHVRSPRLKRHDENDVDGNSYDETPVTRFALFLGCITSLTSFSSPDDDDST